MDHLPNRLLLCGGGSSLKPLTECLEESKWYRGLPFTRRPIIKHIEPADVVGIEDQTGDVVDHTFITAMGLLRVGYDTMEVANDDTTGLRNKLNRILRI